jgi:hypothetical protein
MMEKGPSDLNENELVNSAKKEMEINESRRSFFGKAAGMIIAAVLGMEGKEVVDKATDLNKLKERFNQNEAENIELVNEAANLLYEEMYDKKIELVNTYGTGSNNERVNILRDFLSMYLNSNLGNKNPYKKEIFEGKKYTLRLVIELIHFTS